MFWILCLLHDPHRMPGSFNVHVLIIYTGIILATILRHWCANGASQKFACAIFKDCAPCYHRSHIIAETLLFWIVDANSFN